MNPISLPTIPTPLTWVVRPEMWRLDNEALLIQAGPTTDLFVDPRGEYTKDNAPRLTFTSPDDVYTVQARVKVDFQSDYDAGAFILYANERHWAKFAFEFSPQKQPTIVSVVTHDVSDDCNALTIAGHEVYLRVAKLGQAYAFHASVDGRVWHLIRYFSSNNLENATVNFSAQSPMGEGCTAVFSEIGYTAVLLENLRNDT